ncbi:MAG: hypothetical protein QW478_04185 [Candidatus Micrarchaeaceae archaeon]
MASIKNLTKLMRGVEYGSLSALVMGIFGYVFEIFVTATYPSSTPPALTPYFPLLLGSIGFAVGLASGVRPSSEDILDKVIEREELRMEKENLNNLKSEEEKK